MQRRMALSTRRRVLVTDTFNVGATQATVPAGVYEVVSIKAWGGGGAPRGGISLSTGSGGGGSGGFSERTTALAVVPGQTFTLAIAASVGPGVYNGVTGSSNGNPTTVTYDSTATVVCKANGGGGGAQSPARLGGPGAVTTGAVGDVQTAGVAGGDAVNVTSSDGGVGGTAPGSGGAGGAGGVSGVAGQAGTVPGGGGGGGRGNQAAGGVPGAGAAGRVQITWAKIV